MITQVVEAVGTIFDKLFPDAGEAARMKSEFKKAAFSHDSGLANAMRDVIVSEAQGESAAQRNWRPHLMYMIMGMIVWVGVIVPLIETIFGVKIPVAESFGSIPEKMWSLLQLGVGGYIGGRTLEKSIKTVTGSGVVKTATDFMKKIKEDK